MKSVGEILKKQRESKKFALSDVHKFIKIHPKFLRALEENEYSVFSDKVHAKGFLKVYADFLELDVEQVLAIWRREYGGDFDKKQKKESEFNLKKISPPKVLITPGLILVVVAAVSILGFFGYLFYQYRNYSGVPSLEIYTPQNNTVVDSENVDITGKTDRDSVVLINNQRIIVDSDGSFATSVKLHEGINTFSFLAINKLGRETEEIRTVIYREEEKENEEEEKDQEGVEDEDKDITREGLEETEIKDSNADTQINNP